MAAHQQYIDLFEQAESQLCKHSVATLNAPRREAIEALDKQGFGTTEEYKYTKLETLFAPDYGLNLNRLHIPVNPYEIFHCEVPNMITLLYFVVNDLFYKEEQRKAHLPEGVVICGLCEAAETYPGLVEKYYGKLALVDKDPVNALNTAYAQDGLFIYVPRGVKVEKTLQLVNISRADVDLMSHRRMLIVLEEGAQLRMLACDHALDEKNFLTTQVTEVFIGENATFDFNELEETHTQNHRIANLYVEQEANSQVQLNEMTLHNGLTRNRTSVILKGEGAEVSMLGMAIADQKQQIDNHTFIDHAAPRCRSNELYKYVIDEESIGAFAGKVLVRKDSQHTDSQQTNKNLSLARQARMYTQPQLEIYADDVKCGHGASVGQLDETALFYLRTRGIPEREARLMLMFAFVGDVIKHIHLDALRDRIYHLVEKRFRGELRNCVGCSICK